MIAAALAIRHLTEDTFYFHPWPSPNEQQQLNNGHRLYIWHHIHHKELQEIHDFCRQQDLLDYLFVQVSDLEYQNTIYGMWHDNPFHLGLSHAISYGQQPRTQIQVNEKPVLYNTAQCA